eukprot:m.888681 g.888681  ORF g.888681 m.888681 type:complete len:1150 (+) comp59935_c0_seq1:54-3503(+)
MSSRKLAKPPVRSPSQAATKVLQDLSSQTSLSSVTNTAAPKKSSERAVARHLDAKVSARNSALNAIGGVKVDVFVRVRPPLPSESGSGVCVSVDKEVHGISIVDGERANNFTFDRVYDQADSQHDLFQDAVSPIIEQVARGMACAVITYGQTGAGKTYTMRGDLSGDGSKQGIIQRAVDRMLTEFKEKHYSDVNMKCTFLEIYNEELEDLLRVDPPTARKPIQSKSRLILVDDSNHGSVCQGLTEVEIKDSAGVMQLLSEAEARCHYTETKMNKMSNRAHRIFTIYVNFRRAETEVKTSFTLVDLAGSEDISRSGAKGLTARETAHINKSLLTLGRVINALALNEKHIPYRDSKLTRLLSEALGGVCKTSFIACVSPSDASRVETASTLRYAQRAMEALNIDQLPRWKQDEIVIDSLTRRVRQLEDDLMRQEQVHRKHANSLINQREAARREQRRAVRRLDKAFKVIEKLTQRKNVLKEGLAVASSQRDALEGEKEALRAELLNTRRARDGYLADRDSLSSVLAVVRGMRERLLQAHRETETSLGHDALALKQTIEDCLREIASLHHNVEEKKKLCSKNENVADAFRDRMSTRIRDLVHLVGEFKLAQDTNFGSIIDVLLAVRSEREKETTGLVNHVSKLSEGGLKVLAEVQQYAKSVEQTGKHKTQRRREEAHRMREELNDSIAKLKASVAQTLHDVRNHSTTLQTNATEWATVLKGALGESMDSCASFTSSTVESLKALHVSVSTATAAQLKSLQEQKSSMQQHLAKDKETLEHEADRLATDISAYVQRMIKDFSSLNIRRTEMAITGFCETSTEIANDLQARHDDHKLAVDGLTRAAEDWSESIRTQHSQALAHSNSHQASSIATIDQLRGTVTSGDKELGQRSTALSTAVTAAVERSSVACKEADTGAEQTLAAFGALVARGTKETSDAAEKFKQYVAKQSESAMAASDKLDRQVGTTLDSVRKHVHDHSNDLIETEAMAVRYVVQEITRDLEPLPTKLPHQYPTKYASTAPYGEILADKPADFQREDGILRGSLVPGVPADFKGALGEPDWSGILTSTNKKPLKEGEQRVLADAGTESDVEAYSVHEDAGDEDLATTAEGDEEEETDYNPHDLGEDLDGEAAEAVPKTPTPAAADQTAQADAAP